MLQWPLLDHADGTDGLRGTPCQQPRISGSREHDIVSGDPASRCIGEIVWLACALCVTGPFLFLSLANEDAGVNEAA